MDWEQKRPPTKDKEAIAPDGTPRSPADPQKLAQSLNQPAGAQETAAVTAGAELPASPSSLGGTVVPQPGSVLGGRYEILRQLGEGGMGAVYKARDRELDRFVALKVIRPELANQPEVLQRFKQELILARQVAHKNVIRLVDLGEADGIKFISMDYIEGQDLRSFLKEKGKLTPQEAKAIIVQVCQALEAAHSEGVVHRDLKPQNILIDANEKATVMDFGIAHSAELAGITQTGALLGTPEYMSPEQAKGQKADARSDLFALGVIFYELLTGNTPFKADTALATLLKRTQERACPPAELDPTIPRYLSDVAAKSLETDPRLRYQKASEILTDLQAARRARTITRLRMPRFRIVEEPRTKWIALALASIVLLTVAAFRARIFKPGMRSTPAPPAISLAIIPFRNASGDPSLDWVGAYLAETLGTDIGQSSSLRTVSSDRVQQTLHDLQLTPSSNLDAATARRLAESSDTQTLVWGQYLRFGDQIRIDATLLDLERDHTVPLKAEAPNANAIPGAVDRLAQAIRENLALRTSVLKELEAQAFKPSSKSLPALRDYNDGLQLLRQGKNLEAQKKLGTAIREDPQFALAYAKLAEADVNLGYDNEAEELSRKAVDLGQKSSPQEAYRIAASHARIVRDYPRAIEAYENLAKVLPGDSDVQFVLAGLYCAVGSFGKARDFYGKLLARDPKYVEALIGMGGVELGTGNPKAGIDYFNRALALAVEFENDEEKSAILYEFGVVYNQLSKLEESLRNYELALDIQRRLGEKEAIAQTLKGMAQIQDPLGKPDEALKSLQTALQLFREIGDKSSAGDTLIDLSNYYEAHAQSDQALRMLKESLEIQREVGNQTYEALCLNNIGVNYADKGQYDDALTYLDHGLRIREKLNDPIGIADSNYQMADVLAKFGEFDQALKHYLTALEGFRRFNDKRREAYTSYALGNLFEQQGRLGAALNAKADALKAIREVQDQIGIAEMVGGYAESLNLLGRGEEAQKSLDEALAQAREYKNQALIGENLNFQGDSFFYRGDFKAANTRYEHALQVAIRTTDRRLVLISKFNLAKVAVKQGRSGEAVSSLKGQAQQAGSLGLRHLSLECTVYLAEAMINTKDYARARQGLEQILGKSEKLGSRMETARIHYLLGMAMRLNGNALEAAPHYATALGLLREIQREHGAEHITDRFDVRPIYTESARWAQTSKP